MSGGIFGEAVFGVLRLKISSWFRKYPQKEKTIILSVCHEKPVDKECASYKRGEKAKRLRS